MFMPFVVNPCSHARISGMSDPEFFICVDVETAGPNPADYSLLSIGACLVEDPAQGFYAELQPVNSNHEGEADRVHGLSMQQLSKNGQPPKEALAAFAAWLQEMGGGRQPIFVAFNAPFDWMFVNDYFHHYLGRNPFGHRAVDMKAVFLGRHGGAWEDTGYKQVSQYYGQPEALAHNALEDARQGAQLFGAMLAELRGEEYEPAN